jgi:hypothetical protein
MWWLAGLKRLQYRTIKYALITAMEDSFSLTIKAASLWLLSFVLPVWTHCPFTMTIILRPSRLDTLPFHYDYYPSSFSSGHTALSLWLLSFVLSFWTLHLQVPTPNLTGFTTLNVGPPCKNFPFCYKHIICNAIYTDYCILTKQNVTLDHILSLVAFPCLSNSFNKCQVVPAV